MKSKGLIIGVILVVLALAGVLFLGGSDSESNQYDTPPTNIDDNSGNSDVNSIENSDEEPTTPPLWKTTEFKDINSGDSFTIESLNDKPILLETFAVWCPTCTRQQREIKEFHSLEGFTEEDIISISLDTDASEDEETVLDHVNENGFDWRYAISPSEATQSLIDEFGISIVNAPSVPMILICPDGTATKLDSGVKDVDELKEAVGTCTS